LTLEGGPAAAGLLAIISAASVSGANRSDVADGTRIMVASWFFDRVKGESCARQGKGEATNTSIGPLAAGR
jgi:hypothetical protein